MIFNGSAGQRGGQSVPVTRGPDVLPKTGKVGESPAELPSPKVASASVEAKRDETASAETVKGRSSR